MPSPMNFLLTNLRLVTLPFFFILPGCQPREASQECARWCQVSYLCSLDRFAYSWSNSSGPWLGDSELVCEWKSPVEFQNSCVERCQQVTREAETSSDVDACLRCEADSLENQCFELENQKPCSNSACRDFNHSMLHSLRTESDSLVCWAGSPAQSERPEPCGFGDEKIYFDYFIIITVCS